MVERLRAVRASTKGGPVRCPVPSGASSALVSPPSLVITGGMDAAMEGMSASRTGWCGFVRHGLRDLVLLFCCSISPSAKNPPPCDDGGLFSSVSGIVESTEASVVSPMVAPGMSDYSEVIQVRGVPSKPSGPRQKLKRYSIEYTSNADIPSESLMCNQMFTLQSTEYRCASQHAVFRN